MKGYIGNIKLIVSIIAGVSLFVFARPKLVEVLATDEALNLLVPKNLHVATKVGNNGYRQVKYVLNGKDVFITDGNFTSSDPVSENENVVWMSQLGQHWQIFYYNFAANEEIQLTTNGNNVNPQISGNNVVWEGQVEGIWQIFWYDGIKVTQVTSGVMPKQDVQVSGDFIVFSEKAEDETGWKIIAYNMQTGNFTNLTENGYGKEPVISKNVVIWKVPSTSGDVRGRFNLATRLSPDGEILPEFDTEAYEEYLATLEATSSVDTTTSEVTELQQPEDVTVGEIKEELGISEETEIINVETEKLEETTESTQTN